MKKIILSASLFIFANSLFGQVPDDVLRTAWFTSNGTARMMGAGGVMASLGGDISSNHINPAGLGLYKTNELVLSPGFMLNNNRLSYRGTDTQTNKNNFNYGSSGLILSNSNFNRKRVWTSTAFALSINQIANYNNRIQFKGFNNYSSFSEQYLEELVKDRADTNAALSNYIFGSSLAFRTYLIDTIRGPGGSVAGYQSLVPISTGTNQMYDANSTGGYHELAIGMAGNIEEKMYVGTSLTIPIIQYKREIIYSETDATNQPNNFFQSFEYRESFQSKGMGLGLKLGFLYKPQEFWRIGFAIHSPQIIGFTDKISSSITANTEAYAGTRTETSKNLNSGNDGSRKYSVITPWKAIASLSYVFREVNDTKKQRAFLSTDIEYVNYRGARFMADNNADDLMVQYYELANASIKENYKGNINVKLGGELKFHTVMFRLGAAYYGSPYADENLSANRIIGSGGIGYRNHGYFIDLCYTHILNKDVQFAYRLADKANTFATQTGHRGNISLSFGIKF